MEEQIVGKRLRIITDAYLSVPHPGTLATIMEIDHSGDIWIEFDEDIYDWEAYDVMHGMWAQREDFEILPPE